MADKPGKTPGFQWPVKPSIKKNDGTKRTVSRSESLRDYREYKKIPTEGVILKGAAGELEIDGDVSRLISIPHQLQDAVEEFRIRCEGSETKQSISLSEPAGFQFWCTILICSLIPALGYFFDSQLRKRDRITGKS